MDVRDAVLRALGFVSGAAADEHIRLESEVPGDLPNLSTDSRVFLQILVNLLSNAVKFTPSGGRVTVAAAINKDGWYVISVTDTGVGIPAEQIGKALEPFGQAENRIVDRPKGTGLGLPLVKSLTERHEGVLRLRSDVGKGTCAEILTPPSRVRPIPAREKNQAYTLGDTAQS